jgi:AcrR family transcriptional regulator
LSEGGKVDRSIQDHVTLFSMRKASAPIVQRRLYQEEKSSETRKRLLDAAVLCLAELGYAKSTTARIAEYAGVSRGCQTYHFGTRAELLTGAVEHVLQLFLSEFREKVSRIPSEADRWKLTIDLLWKFLCGPVYRAWQELLIAARADDELRDSVRGVNDRMEEYVVAEFRELFPRPEGGGRASELIPFIFFYVLEGMALEAGAVRADLVEEILRLLKRIDWVAVAKADSAFQNEAGQGTSAPVRVPSRARRLSDAAKKQA